MVMLHLFAIAFTGQRYKIWKQITTVVYWALETKRLLLLVKDTKFESKSQRNWGCGSWRPNCFYWSKIQNLKANHNNTPKNETAIAIAFTGQRYKIWKQITTPLLRQRAKMQLLLLVKDTKFESKSQPSLALNIKIRNCFYWSKIQNLKANHNGMPVRLAMPSIAFTGQRYKIWKQITTILNQVVYNYKLLLLVKDTKFESKSQHNTKGLDGCFYCFYWSKIQNLKANHNSLDLRPTKIVIAFTGQRYKIWKQITTFPFANQHDSALLLLVKDTKFESKSQPCRQG